MLQVPGCQTEWNFNPNPDVGFTTKIFKFRLPRAKNETQDFRKIVKVCVGYQVLNNVVKYKLSTFNNLTELTYAASRKLWTAFKISVSYV